MLQQRISEQESQVQAELRKDSPAPGQAKRCTERIKYLYKLSALHFPIHAKAVVGALVVAKHMIQDPSAIASVLAQKWLPAFSEQPNNPVIGNKVLVEATKDNQWDWTKMRDVGPRTFHCVLRGIHDTAPGPDGLPYSCFGASRDTSADILD
eukprot:1609502-Karenia_brevis.AAC.1